MTWRQPTYEFKLIIDGVEHTIEEPDGFTAVKSTIKRDMNLHGVFYEFTPNEFPLKFTGTAKRLLREAFENDGIDSESRVNFLHEKTDFTTAVITSQTFVGVSAFEKQGELPAILNQQAGTVYDGKMWVSGGNDGSSNRDEVYSSSDGITWTEVGALPAIKSNHNMLTFLNKMWVIGGLGSTDDRVYSSSDGVAWTDEGQNPFGAVWHNGGGIVYDSKMWLTGGDIVGGGVQSKVYYTTDGTTWAEAGTNSLPGSLRDHDMVVYDSKMWLFGGLLGGAVTDKVYNSTDGITWTLIGTMPRPLRYLQAETYLDHIYISSGQDDLGNRRDETYFTEDGDNYTETSPSPYVLTHHVVLVFDETIWIIGGNSGSVESGVYSASISYEYTSEYQQQTVYAGNIDFSNAKEDQQYFYCSVLRSDLLVNILNNKDKQVNLFSEQTIFGKWSYPENLQDIYLHSFKIQKLWKGVQTDSTQFETGTTSLYLQYGWEEITEEEINDDQGLTYGVNLSEPDAFWILATAQGDFTLDITYDIDYYNNFSLSSGGPADIEQSVGITVRFYDSNDNLISINPVDSYGETNELNNGQNNIISGSLTGTATVSQTGLQTGDKIKFWVANASDGPGGISGSSTIRLTTQNMEVEIQANTIEPATTAKGILVKDALESCLQIITELPAPLNSDFFDNCGANNLITNGWQIRKFEDEPITVSWSKLFGSLQTIFGLGYGIEGTQVKVELWEHFYADEELIDLGDVGDYEEEVIGDEVFNQVKIGFKSWANDENLSNTKEDFHTEAAWSTPIKNHKGTFEKRSDILLSSFLIESVRRDQFKEKPSESTKWDDDIFMIALKDNYDDPYYMAERESDIYESVTGLTNPGSAYNLRHTIKRILLNWGVWINSFSMRYKEVTAKLRGLYFRNNGDLTTRFLSSEECFLGDIDKDIITEGDDIEKGDIQGGEAMFDQKVIRFTKTLSDEQLDIIRDAHEGQGDNYNVINYGYISVTDYEGTKKKGWLLEATYNIHDQQAKFILLKRFSAGRFVFDLAWSCLPDKTTGLTTYNVISTNTPGQWVSFVKGTINTLTIDKTDSGTESVTLYICLVQWDGEPDTANKIYDQTISLEQGDNTIELNLEISDPDVYFIGFEHISDDVSLQLVTEIGNSGLICLTDHILPSQTFSSSAWNEPTVLRNIKHKLTYTPTLQNTRTLLITGIAGGSFDVTHIANKAAQTLDLPDNQIESVKINVTVTGTLSVVIRCDIYDYDDTQTGNLGDHKASGYSDTVSASGEVSFDAFYTDIFQIGTLGGLPAGKYVFVFTKQSGDALSGSNYYSIEYTTDDFPYLTAWGVYQEIVVDGSWSENTARNLKIKVTYGIS